MSRERPWRWNFGGLRRGISFSGLAMGMLGIVFVLRAALMPLQTDTFWHLRAGADLVRTGTIARVDGYSFTAAGWPWRNPEWLWEPFAWGCWRLGGMPLLTLATAVIVLAGVALSHRLMVGRPSIRFVLLLIALPLLNTVWVARPHTFTLLALPLLLTLVVRERWWPIPLLFLLWANVHGGVAFGGLLLTVATAVALLRWALGRGAEGGRDDGRRVRALAIVLALSGLATLATPLGLDMFEFLADSMGRIRAIGIGEWQPARPTVLLGAVWSIVGAGFVVLVVARLRTLRAGGHASSFADWTLVAGSLAMFPLTFAAMRHIGPFLLVALPAASRLLGPDARLPLPARKHASAPAGDEHPLVNLALLGALSLAAVGLVGWTYRFGGDSLHWYAMNDREIAAVRGCDGPLYNQYDEGGLLPWFVPERPIFIDSRQDPYPLPHMLAALDVQWQRAPYRPLFERWKIRCAFLPASSEMPATLERDGWITRFRNDRFVVLAAAPAPLPNPLPASRGEGTGAATSRP